MGKHRKPRRRTPRSISSAALVVAAVTAPLVATTANAATTTGSVTQTPLPAEGQGQTTPVPDPGVQNGPMTFHDVGEVVDSLEAAFALVDDPAGAARAQQLRQSLEDLDRRIARAGTNDVSRDPALAQQAAEKIVDTAKFLDSHLPADLLRTAVTGAGVTRDQPSGSPLDDRDEINEVADTATQNREAAENSSDRLSRALAPPNDDRPSLTSPGLTVAQAYHNEQMQTSWHYYLSQAIPYWAAQLVASAPYAGTLATSLRNINATPPAPLAAPTAASSVSRASYFQYMRWQARNLRESIAKKIGAQRPTGAAGLTEPVPVLRRESGPVYRWDVRDSQEVFAHGFQPQGTSKSLINHILHHRSKESSYVSTSRNPEMGFANPKYGRFRYEVDLPGGIDSNATTNGLPTGKGLSRIPGEQEILFDGGIPAGAVKNVKYQKLNPDGSLGEWVTETNPNYLPMGTDPIAPGSPSISGTRRVDPVDLPLPSIPPYGIPNTAQPNDPLTDMGALDAHNQDGLLAYGWVNREEDSPEKADGSIAVAESGRWDDAHSFGLHNQSRDPIVVRGFKIHLGGRMWPDKFDNAVTYSNYTTGENGVPISCKWNGNWEYGCSWLGAGVTLWNDGIIKVNIRYGIGSGSYSFGPQAIDIDTSAGMKSLTYNTVKSHKPAANGHGESQPTQNWLPGNRVTQ